MIKGQNITLTYGKKDKAKTILNGVSFEIKKGSLTAFIGRSGAGKTSILRCLGGITQDYEGDISFGGNSLKTLDARQRISTVGFVFQQFHLFPHMTVFKNCLHPLIKVLKLSKAEAIPKIDEFLHLLGISHLAHMYPSELSGGQQQRAAIARALCLGSDVLLLDEPTSALDPESRNALVSILSTLRSKGMTVVLSSHDVAFLKCVLDQVVFLENGMVAESYESATESLETKPKILQFMQS